MRSPVSILRLSPPCKGICYTLALTFNWYRLFYIGLQVASICFLLAVLAGCRPPDQSPAPVLYEDLCVLTHEQMGVMDDESLRQWIEKEYSNVPLRSQEVISGELITIYVWEYEGITGNAYLRDGSLFRVSSFDLEGKAKGQPTFGQVVAGLGTPEIIEPSAGMYEPLAYTIVLHYPTLGVSVSGTNVEPRERLTHEGKLAVLLTEDMQVDNVDCYIPGSIEEVLQTAFFASPEDVLLYMRNRMPWPGFGALVPLIP